MGNDTALNRLLYAILSQKNLRDIDWEKVADDPILRLEITNGHAARMRYSRWKKQMEKATPEEGASPASNEPRRQRPTPVSPRKNRVEKTKPIKKEKGKGREERMKREFEEREHSIHSRSHSPERMPQRERYVKTESGLRRTKVDQNIMLATPGPSTPRNSNHAYSREQSQTPSPCTSFGNIGAGGEADEFVTSFDAEPGLYSPMMPLEGMNAHWNGMELHNGMTDTFAYWDPANEEGSKIISSGSQIGTEVTSVKTEPRWDDASYRHI